MKADESVQQNLIYNASTDHVTTDNKDKSQTPADRDKSQLAGYGVESHMPQSRDKPGRPVPKPRTASTSSLDQSLESDTAVRPRPRARASQESLDKNLDKPPQLRPRARGSQDSLDKSLDHEDKPVPGRRTRGSVDKMDDRPTPAVRAGSMESLDSIGRPKPRAVKGAGSMESLDSIGRPKPRARASVDRSLDDPSRPPPQVAGKPARKPVKKDYQTSDQTDV